MSNILRLVSLARKAGKLEVGEEPTAAAARGHYARLIIVAKDATENTYRRVRHFGDASNATWVSVPYTKEELGASVGRSAVAMVTVTDIGLAAAVVRGLAEDDPEKFAVTMERMNTKADKALRRQQEKRQHEKNVKSGKFRTKQQAKKPEEQPEREPETPARREEDRRPERKPGSGHFGHSSRPRSEGDSRRGQAEGGKRRFGDSSRNPRHAGGKPYGGRRKKSGRSNPYEQFGSDKRPGGRGGVGRNKT